MSNIEEIVVPEFTESVADATIATGIKAGEFVKRDEVLVEE